jgi:hypothetical protein
VLELHGKLAESMDNSKLLIKNTLCDKLAETNSKLEAALALNLKQSHNGISNMLFDATKHIMQFDVHDMNALMTSQKEALQNALDRRISFMPKIQSCKCIFRSCPSNIAILLPKCKRATTRNIAINVETLRS